MQNLVTLQNQIQIQNTDLCQCKQKLNLVQNLVTFRTRLHKEALFKNSERTASRASHHSGTERLGQLLFLIPVIPERVAPHM